MKIKRDNFTRRNREKSNIKKAILESLKPESQNLIDPGLRKSQLKLCFENTDLG